MSTRSRRIAVVIPCYDAGDTLAESVASAVAEADELVIVDDGSQDPNTLAVLADHANQGFEVVRRENGGPAAARMAGVAATVSPYVFPLDSDDILMPGALIELADALDEHPSAAAAWGDLETFGLTNYRIPSVPALDPWFVTYATLLPTSSLFRREALTAVGGWQPPDAFEDWNLWMGLAEHGLTGVYVPRVVYRYRRREEGLMMTSLERYGELYAELARQHCELFADRERNRRLSSAPAPIKFLLPLADRVPGLDPLKRLWVAQLLAHLFWNGGLRTTTSLLIRALGARTRGVVAE
jgi:glycosyltransferase involved in cell wall biosynthesis